MFRRNLHEGLPALSGGAPGAFLFAAYLDEGEREVTIVHAFRDADALDRHLEGAMQRASRAAEFLEPQAFLLYGSPSESALAIFRRSAEATEPHATLTLIPAYAGGFIRPDAS